MGLLVDELDADLAAAQDLSSGESGPEPDAVGVFLIEKKRLARIAAGMGMRTAEADDVLGDVSIRAIETTEQFGSRQDCVRWLVKVTVNRCLLEHRRHRTFASKATEILRRRTQTSAAAGAAKLIAAEELGLVREGLRNLDGALLAPLVLRYFCDLDSTEIGRVLDVKASTVRSRLRQARRVLAHTLAKKGLKA